MLNMTFHVYQCVTSFPSLRNAVVGKIAEQRPVATLSSQDTLEVF